jgi:hypothetical protein
MSDRPGFAAAKLRPTDLVSSWYTQKLLALTILKVPVLYDRSILSYVSSLFDSIDNNNNNNHNGIHSSTRTNPVSLKIPGSLVPVIMCTDTDDRCPLLEPRFSKLKQSIIAPEKKQRVIDSYKRVVQACHQEAEFIRKIGPNAVPEIDFEDILQNGEVIVSPQ